MKKKAWPVFFFLMAWAFIDPTASAAQLVLGQYEDEAPLRTWNTFPFATASSLGRGETSFSFASDASAALTNPSLLLHLPKVSFVLNSSYNSASLFKYSIVNTGILRTEKNLTLGLYAIDFAGVSLHIGKWAVGLAVALSEIYDRPVVQVESSYQGNPYYLINLRQEGLLRTFHFSLARSLGRRVQAGLGINFVTGKLEKEIFEQWFDTNLTITDTKSWDFSGIFLNAGLTIGLTEKWNAGVIFRSPFLKKSKSQSLWRYNSPAGKTEISIGASSEDTYRQPLVIGLGTSYKFSELLRFSTDISFTNWSKYEVDFFGEELKRSFRDIFRVGVGVEYLSYFRLFGQYFTSPLRVGFIFDPQPMREPKSSYYYLAIGSGVYWKGLALDFATLIGQENGSGSTLSGRKLALSVRYQL